MSKAQQGSPLYPFVSVERRSEAKMFSSTAISMKPRGSKGAVFIVLIIKLSGH